MKHIDMISSRLYENETEKDLLVSAGGFPLVMVLTGPSFIWAKLKWSVELGFDQ